MWKMAHGKKGFRSIKSILFFSTRPSHSGFKLYDFFRTNVQTNSWQGEIYFIEFWYFHMEDKLGVLTQDEEEKLRNLQI